MGTFIPDEGVDVNLFELRDDDRWEIAIYPDPVMPTVHNPLQVRVDNQEVAEFWPDCMEDLEALVRQIGRYGWARPAPGGWEVHATITAADARTTLALVGDDFLHLVHRDGRGWTFAASSAPVPVAAAPGPSPAPAPVTAGTAGTLGSSPTSQQDKDHTRPLAAALELPPGTAASRHAFGGGADTAGRGR